jgi:hypothetical protein
LGRTIRQISTPVRVFGLAGAALDGLDGVEVDGVEGDGVEVDGVEVDGVEVDGVEVDVDVAPLDVEGAVVMGAGAAPATPPIPTVRVRTARPPKLNFPIPCIFASSRVVWSSQRR